MTDRNGRRPLRARPRRSDVPRTGTDAVSLDDVFAAAVGHHAAGRLSDAEALYRQILDRQQQQPVVLHHLGLIAGQTGRSALGIALIRQALALRPDYAEAESNLGVALRGQRAHDQAVVALSRAITLRPDLAGAHNNLGAVYKEQGRLDEAITAFRAAIMRDPDHPELHCNLAAALLQRGDYAEGWREHEWRLHERSIWAQPRQFSQPRWQGESLRGRTILLHSEQGFGDDLQFARYCTPIAAMAGRVVLQVPACLTRLLATVPGVAEVLPPDAPLPPFDVHLSLMSAPFLLQSTQDRVQANVPYVTPDPAQTARWRQRLAGLAGRKVGLVWAGDPRLDDPRAHRIDRLRSMRLAQFMPLLRIPDITVVSLQMGDAARQRDEMPPSLSPQAVMEGIADFADTAALVAALDLVITVDTAVAHLAGALGKPVWILSRFNGCWRWLPGRSETAWYPTARLFHQAADGDWDAVVVAVCDALRRWQRDPGFCFV